MQIAKAAHTTTWGSLLSMCVSRLVSCACWPGTQGPLGHRELARMISGTSNGFLLMHPWVCTHLGQGIHSAGDTCTWLAVLQPWALAGPSVGRQAIWEHRRQFLVGVQALAC